MLALQNLSLSQRQYIFLATLSSMERSEDVFVMILVDSVIDYLVSKDIHTFLCRLRKLFPSTSLISVLQHIDIVSVHILKGLQTLDTFYTDASDLSRLLHL